MAKKEETLVEEVVEKKSQRELRRLLKNKDLDVEIVNLTSGTVFYRCPKTFTEINLATLGDTETVALDVLVTMKNKHRGMFYNYVVGIIDVYDDEFTVDDIITYLGLDDVFSEELDAEYIDELIKKADAQTFEDVVNKSGLGFVKRIAERAVDLYKSGKFDSRYKGDILSKKLNIDDIFNI